MDVRRVTQTITRLVSSVVATIRTRFFKGQQRFVHFMWLGLILMFLLSSRCAGPTDMTDKPLAYSEGRIAWVRPLKHGCEVLPQPDPTVKSYEHLFMHYSRSALFESNLIQINQRLRVDRFGDEIGNCWVGDKQICFSRCISDLECKEKLVARNQSELYSFGGFMVIIYLVTLAWVASTPTNPSEGA